MNITGINLKKLRLKKNITLDQLAIEINEKFNINITKSMLSRWETGKAVPVYEHLKRLALYYNVSTDFLLGLNQYDDSSIIESNNNLDTKPKIRCSKKNNKIKAVVKLLEDDKITNKDILFIQEFIHLFMARKDKSPYR